MEHLTDVKLVDLGSIELKGVIEPVHVYGVAGDGHEWLDAPLLTGQITRGICLDSRPSRSVTSRTCNDASRIWRRPVWSR